GLWQELRIRPATRESARNCRPDRRSSHGKDKPAYRLQSSRAITQFHGERIGPETLQLYPSYAKRRFVHRVEIPPAEHCQVHRSLPSDANSFVKVRQSPTTSRPTRYQIRTPIKSVPNQRLFQNFPQSGY